MVRSIKVAVTNKNNGNINSLYHNTAGKKKYHKQLPECLKPCMRNGTDRVNAIVQAGTTRATTCRACWALRMRSG